MNAKGRVTQQREPKPAYATVQRSYKQVEASAPAQ